MGFLVDDDDDDDDDDDNDEACDFSSTTTLLMVKLGDKSFCSTDCNRLVCFWAFDEEMELWVKECAEDGCSVGLCMNHQALGPGTWVSSSGKKQPTTSITPFETFSMSQLAIRLEWLWSSLRDSLYFSINLGKIFDSQ